MELNEPDKHMKQLLFASSNKHKADEIRSLLPPDISIITLFEAGIDIDIPEPHATLQENAREKSMTIYKLSGQNCFAEDTGLEVDALNGEPGVKTARYAGEPANMEKNIQKLLAGLEGKENRNARFRTVISLIIDGKEHNYEGVCEGRIAAAESGSKGFGYDPVFIPEGSNKTFSEMDLQEKNQYSHRRKAVMKMVKEMEGGK